MQDLELRRIKMLSADLTKGWLMQYKNSFGYHSLIILLLDSYYLLLRASVVSLLTTS